MMIWLGDQRETKLEKKNEGRKALPPDPKSRPVQDPKKKTIRTHNTV